MACYHPIRFYKAGVTEKGKMRLATDSRGTEGEAIYVPCGSCIGCRLDRARSWAIRCMHESDMHEVNSFVTLTYERVPLCGSLCVRHFQLFMKQLRKHLDGRKVRFFHAGEYGEENGRPHYHVAFFGLDFKDKILLSERDGIKLYTSPSLEKLWGRGFVVVGQLTYESAAYVARYCLKKINGPCKEVHYGGRRSEYTTMSRNPGIGATWFKQYHKDVYPSDEVIANGRSYKPPRFYDKLLDKMSPELLESVKMDRIKHSRGSDPFALANREINKMAQIGPMKRRV